MLGVATQNYVAYLLLTFTGGFLTAHALFRFSKKEDKPAQVSLPANHAPKKGLAKQVSDTSTCSPETPVNDEEKQQVAGASPTAGASVFSAAAHLLHLGGKSVEEESEAAESLGRSANGLSLERLASGTSGIPTDIHVPELVFGRHIDAVGDQGPDVIPFSTYAPCRLLDVNPDSPSNETGAIFNGLRFIAAFYLRADNGAICDCIQKYGLNDLFYSVARLEMAFKKTLRSGSERGQRSSMIAQAAEEVVDREACLGPRGADESEAVRGVVAALMHELECILHEYLSFNWDQAEEIYEINTMRIDRGSLPRLWKSGPTLHSCPDTPDPENSSMPACEGESCLSRNVSNLTELLDGQPSSPGSVQSDAGFSGGLKASSSTSSLAELVRKRLDESEAETFSNQRSEAESTSHQRSSPQSELQYKGDGKASRSRRKVTYSDDPRTPPKKQSRKSKKHSRQKVADNLNRAKDAYQKGEVTKDMFGPQRRFMTLQQMFEDMNRAKEEPGRQPIILLLGGGMAAGKSTVREIIGKDGFWSKVGKDAVVVEADAIKNMEGLFKSLSRLDMLDMLDRLNRDGDDVNRHMHEYSTKAAENMLVAAVNEQKDVVFDGTMTWAPFVQQTIAMVRDHRHNYKRGPGFVVDDEGNSYERYWEIDDSNGIDLSQKQPYRIELVGVTCDTGLAVARGIWRKIRSGRSVPVPSQLRSHRLFAENFESFASAVDSATLYHTGSALTTFNKGHVDLSPTIIAHRSSYTRGELLINPTAFKSFKNKVKIHDQAASRRDLYESAAPCIGKVPTTDEDQMSTLRHVFRAAHKKELKAKTKRPIPRSVSLW